MFHTFNYFKMHNQGEEITDYKEFYKKFSNLREFGGGFSHYDHLIKNRFLNIHGHMVNILLREMPSSVLDIGCGAGINLPLSRLFPMSEFTGVDYAEKAIMHAKEVYPEIDFHVKDAFNLGYVDKFDLAIISSVLILYKEKLDRLQLLENAKTSVKVGGLLIAIVWKDSWLLKYSIRLSRVISKIRGIQLPTDFMGVHFSESEAVSMFNEAGLIVEDKIHTSSQYGALESVRYLNMGKYKRNFKSAEKQEGFAKPQNTLKDLQRESGSNHLMRLFYWLEKFIPSSLNMYSIYILRRGE